MSRRETTGAVFLDLKRAFATVWHEVLVHKLVRLGFTSGMVKLLASYLRDRTFRVKMGARRSSSGRILAGVPQGSILGPELYILYTSDVPRTQQTHLAIYADDTAVYSTSRSEGLVHRRLQTAVDGLTEWASK